MKKFLPAGTHRGGAYRSVAQVDIAATDDKIVSVLPEPETGVIGVVVPLLHALKSASSSATTNDLRITALTEPSDGNLAP